MFLHNSVLLVVREGGKGRAEQEWMCFDAGAGGADMKMSGGSSAINGSGVENDGRVSNRITPSQHHIMRPPSSPFPPQPKREGIRVAIQLAKKTVRWPFRCLLRRIFRRISGVKSSWAMV